VIDEAPTASFQSKATLVPAIDKPLLGETKETAGYAGTADGRRASIKADGSVQPDGLEVEE
jgi:hypothetical protein